MAHLTSLLNVCGLLHCSGVIKFIFLQRQPFCVIWRRLFFSVTTYTWFTSHGIRGILDTFLQEILLEHDPQYQHQCIPRADYEAVMHLDETCGCRDIWSSVFCGLGVCVSDLEVASFPAKNDALWTVDTNEKRQEKLHLRESFKMPPRQSAFNGALVSSPEYGGDLLCKSNSLVIKPKTVQQPGHLRHLITKTLKMMAVKIHFRK